MERASGPTFNARACRWRPSLAAYRARPWSGRMGRFTGPGLRDRELPGSAHFIYFTLEQSPASTADLYSIHRLYPHAEALTSAPPVSGLRFEPSRPGMAHRLCQPRRAVAAAAPGAAWTRCWAVRSKGCGARRQYVVIDAHAALPSPSAPLLGDVFFPIRSAARADVLGACQPADRDARRSRHVPALPLGAALDAVGGGYARSQFADMKRMTFPMASPSTQPPPGSTVAPEIRTRHPRPPSRAAGSSPRLVRRLDGSD